MPNRHLIAATLLGVLGVSAWSQTILVVDSSGGAATFAAVQPAIDAAQPGDTVVIVARPSTYASFQLDKGLTLVGDTGQFQNAVSILPSTIQGVPAGEVALVAGLESVPLTVTGCQGPVVVERTLRRFTAHDNVDLRLHSIRDEQFEVRIPSSGRFELVDAEVRGYCSIVTKSGAGASAQFHLACPRLYGIDAYASPGFGCTGFWDGEAPLLVSGTIDFVLTGRRGTDYLSGTQCSGPSPCPGFYWGGPALRCYGAVLRRTAVATYPGCSLFPTGMDLGGTLVVSPPSIEPSMLFSGTPRPGAVLMASVDGEAGDAVTLGVGRSPTVAPVASSPIPALIVVDREVPLGLLPASGEVRVPIVIPQGATPGTAFHFQAGVTSPSGTLRLSNSIAVIVRP